jgi:DivIVA domain-containing protein
MPSTELDLPLLFTPEQIRRREFVQTRRGYDSTQVRDYLEQIARQAEQMQALLREARMEADAATKASASKTDPYEQLANRIADLLRSTDRLAEQVKADARAEAETILREARADADRIRLDAQSQAEEAREHAERALREARERADQTISGLSSRRAALVDQLASMQERLLSVARELDEAIDHPSDAEDTTAIEREIGEAWSIPEAGGGDAPEPPPSEIGPALDDDRVDRDGPDRVEVIDLEAQELWVGEDMELQIPEIPPLDLEWDADED